MEQYKECPIIQVDGGAVTVDKNVEVELNDWIICDDSDEQYQTVNHNKIIKTLLPKGLNDKLWVKIISHTGIDSLKDSNLPLFEIPDRTHQMALQVYPQIPNIEKQKQIDIEKQISKRIGWEEGYKAAGGYTEEDMKTAILQAHLATKITVHNRYLGENGYENLEKDILKSFKKYPTSALIKMDVNPHFDHHAFEGNKPKVDKNNRLIINQFNYGN